MIVAIGVVIGVLFLEETHELKKHRRDPGLECGRRLLNYCRKSQTCDHFTKADDAYWDESRSLLEDEEPPGYRTIEGSLQDPSTRSQSPDAVPPISGTKEKMTKSYGAHKVFTKQIVLTITAFGILA